MTETTTALRWAVATRWSKVWAAQPSWVQAEGSSMSSAPEEAVPTMKREAEGHRSSTAPEEAERMTLMVRAAAE